MCVNERIPLNKIVYFVLLIHYLIFQDKEIELLHQRIVELETGRLLVKIGNKVTIMSFIFHQ